MSKIVFALIGSALAVVTFVVMNVLAHWLIPLASGYSRKLGSDLPDPGLLGAFCALAVYHSNCKLYVGDHPHEESIAGHVVAITMLAVSVYRIGFPIAYWFDRGIWPAIILYLSALAISVGWSLVGGLIFRLLMPDWLLNRLNPYDGWLMGLVLSMATWPALLITATYLPLGGLLGSYLGAR